MNTEQSIGRGSRLPKIERAFIAVLHTASLWCLIALLLLVAVQVLARAFPVVSVSWIDEVVEASFAWMVFLGAAVLWRNGDHITVDILTKPLAGKTSGRLLNFVLLGLNLLFLCVFTWQGAFLTAQTTRTWTPMLDLPKSIWYAVIPLSGLVMLMYTLSRGIRDIKALFSARTHQQGSVE
jgi:TRAP-type C4-dicarboxylate transport system permease small subunit